MPGSRWRVMRTVLWLTVGSTGLFGCGRLAGAQTQVTPDRGGPSAAVPVTDAPPAFAAPPSDLAPRFSLDEAERPAAGPEFRPGTLPPSAGRGASWGCSA